MCGADVSRVVAEYDAVTSMVGIVDMLLRRPMRNTGIGTALNKKNDAYERFGKSIQKAFTFFKNQRADVKKATQGGGYGQNPTNISESYMFTMLSEALKDATSPESIATFQGMSNSIKNEIILKSKELKEQVSIITKSKEIREKLATVMKAADAEELIRNVIKTTDSYLLGKGKELEVWIKYRLLSYADSLQTLKMRIESSTMKRSAELDTALLQGDTIQLLTFLEKVETKNLQDITMRELQAASSLLAKNKTTVVTKALSESFGQDFITLQNRTKKTFQRGYFKTRIVLHDTKVTTKMANDIYKELGIKGNDKLNMDMHLMKENIKNAWDFIDALHLMGYDSMVSKTVYDLLPKFRNGFGDPIPFVTNKGTGYHVGTQMQYSMFSVINDPLPYLLHSIDSSLVAKASRGQNFINHRWDAFMDSNSFDVSHNANMASDWLRRNSNVYKDMEDSYISTERTMNSFSKKAGNDGVLKEIARDMARQEYALSGKKMDKEILDNRAKEILKEIRNEDFIKDISKSRKELTDLSKDLETQTTEMQHYTNEDPDTLVDKITPEKSSKLNNMETVVESSDYTPSSFDKERLKNVNTDGYTLNELDKFELMSLKDTSFTMDIESIKDGTSSMYDKNR